jgi:hypothetical protein
MADDDKKNSSLEQLNIVVSTAAAIFGIVVTIQTINLNREVDRLNENIEASSLVGDLIGSLTSDSAKQDIALLALDNALSSDSDESQEDREERYKILVAKIATNLLNRSLSVTEGEDGASLGREIREETRTARDILKKLLPDNSLDYYLIAEDESYPEYQRVSARALMDFEERANSSKAPTDTAQVQVQYDEVSADANPNEVIRAEVNSDDEDQSSLQQEQQTLELATSADAVSGVAEDSDNRGIVYLHYDASSLSTGMEQLKVNLENENWFVTNSVELIKPDAFNCSVRSDIRFFHEDDEELARQLKAQVESTSISDISPHVDAIRLIDLSNWEKANLVPNKQLELWIIANGDICAGSRN